MKAARFPAYGPADLIRIDDVPEPVAGPGQVAIDVVCAAVNPVDVKMRAGSHRALVWWTLPHGTGMDLAGIVHSVGAGVTRLRPGDAVWSTPKWTFPGAFQERTVAEAFEVGLLPAGLGFDQGAGLPLVGLTALQCLDEVRLAAGERLLVHGASGAVGMVAAQLAVQRGATVIGTAGARNLARVAGLGVEAIDRTGDWLARLRDVDAVVVAADCDLLAVVRAVRAGTRIAHITGDLPDAVKRYGPVLGAVVGGAGMAWPTVVGLTRGVRCRPVLKYAHRRDLDRLAEAVTKGLRVWIDCEFPLDGAAAAHRRQEEGPSGKVIVRVRPDPGAP
jgi:NADPH:quinone reductase-like Zn-dependent oxidoreductase